MNNDVFNKLSANAQKAIEELSLKSKVSHKPTTYDSASQVVAAAKYAKNLIRCVNTYPFIDKLTKVSYDLCNCDGQLSKMSVLSIQHFGNNIPKYSVHSPVKKLDVEYIGVPNYLQSANYTNATVKHSMPTKSNIWLIKYAFLMKSLTNTKHSWKLKLSR